MKILVNLNNFYLIKKHWIISEFETTSFYINEVEYTSVSTIENSPAYLSTIESIFLSTNTTEWITVSISQSESSSSIKSTEPKFSLSFNNKSTFMSSSEH